MLSSTTNKVIYDISGISTPIATGYEIPFRIFEVSDIVVTVALDTGENNDLAEGWSIQIPSSSAGVYKVVFDSGYSFPEGALKLVISRSVSITQGVDLRNGGRFDADVQEEMFDRQTAVSQQLSEEIGRAFKLPISELPENLTFPSASERAGKIIGFNENGQELKMYSNLDATIEAANAANQQSSQILQDVTTLKEQTDDAKEAAEEAQGKAEDAQAAAEQAKSDTQDIADEAETTIGNSNTTGLRGDAVTAIQTALENALNSIGQSNNAGARGDAIKAITAALNSALASIGQTNNAGARGAALTAIATALTNALAAIGQTNDTGARGQAIAAISAALTSTLSAIAAKETQVNSDLDSKLASANSTIDGKVSAAEESASAAAGSASDAADSVALAEKWASNPEDTPVTGEGDTAKYSSYHWARKAEEAANSPLASESSAGRIRATSNASYVRPEGMTEPVAYTVEAVNAIKTALQTSLNTLEGKFAFVDSSYEAVITPDTEQTA